MIDLIIGDIYYLDRIPKTLIGDCYIQILNRIDSQSEMIVEYRADCGRSITINTRSFHIPSTIYIARNLSEGGALFNFSSDSMMYGAIKESPYHKYMKEVDRLLEE